MRISTATPPAPPVADVEPIVETMALAAAPAVDMARAANEAPQGEPSWWAEYRQVMHDPIMSRGTRLSVADPISMPLTVARDLGGDEPVPDLAATARIVPTLSSPIADRWATWAKHVTLIATIGRSHWVLLEPEDMPPSLRTGWPVGLAGGWVVVSPFDRAAQKGTMVTLTLDGGHTVTVDSSRILTGQRSGRLLSGEPYCETRTLIEQALLSDRVNTAMWSRTDTSAQAMKILSIEGGDRRPAMSEGQAADPQAQTIVAGVMATLKRRLNTIVRVRKDPASRAPMVVAGRGDNPLAVADMGVAVDGGLVGYGTWSDGRVAVGFGVPTSALNGEEPKYANKFVDQITFKRSESGILAREVCAAAMPVLAAITAGTPDAGTILWLDPTPLIEEARDDAASARGTMAAAVGGTPATLAERVNEVVARAEAGLFADAEMLVMGDPDDRDRMAETMALNAVAAARDLAALLDAPDVADEVRREAQDAALDALAESLAELDGGALAAAIGVPTIVRRIIDRVKRAVFGEPTSPAADDAPNLAPIIDRVGISPYLTAALPGVEQVWVYGLPSSRENPYAPHMRNDGAVGSKPGDFSGQEPDGSPCFPGGHNGCQCYMTLKVA